MFQTRIRFLLRGVKHGKGVFVVDGRALAFHVRY